MCFFTWNTEPQLHWTWRILRRSEEGLWPLLCTRLWRLPRGMKAARKRTWMGCGIVRLCRAEGASSSQWWLGCWADREARPRRLLRNLLRRRRHRQEPTRVSVLGRVALSYPWAVGTHSAEAKHCTSSSIVVSGQRCTRSRSGFSSSHTVHGEPASSVPE